jgi:hypothetical protein
MKTNLQFAYLFIVYSTTMATNAIITSANLDISKVTFGEIRMNKAGGKSVPIKYNGQNLQFRVPKMMYPMGINIKDTDSGATTYQLSATLKGCDPYAKERASADLGDVGNLYNFLLDMQEKLLDTAAANSGRWFGKTRDRNVLSALMKSFISPSVEKVNGEWVPSGKYPPSFRMKVPVYDGVVSMSVVDGTGKPVEVDTENIAGVFPKRVEASLAISPSVYVSGQGFGVTWRVTHARVSPPNRLTAADVFADEIDEEVSVKPIARSSPVQEEENEEEHEEEEVSVPVATPAPAPAPSVGVKNRRRAAASAT